MVGTVRYQRHGFSGGVREKKPGTMALLQLTDKICSSLLGKGRGKAGRSAERDTPRGFTRPLSQPSLLGWTRKLFPHPRQLLYAGRFALLPKLPGYMASFEAPIFFSTFLFSLSFSSWHFSIFNMRPVSGRYQDYRLWNDQFFKSILQDGRIMYIEDLLAESSSSPRAFYGEFSLIFIDVHILSDQNRYNLLFSYFYCKNLV